jgi:hypothetical protein
VIGELFVPLPTKEEEESQPDVSEDERFEGSIREMIAGRV